jgi:hypothetical protein
MSTTLPRPDPENGFVRIQLCMTGYSPMRTIEFATLRLNQEVLGGQINSSHSTQTYSDATPEIADW